MSDQQALFDAILAAPDDDAPRLVFADWLDEHGQEERAEFIRVQCRLARMPAECALARPLLTRCAELDGQRLQPEWRKALRSIWPTLASDYGPPIVLRRGFVDEIALFYGMLFEQAAELCRAAPLRRWELRGFDVPIGFEGDQDMWGGTWNDFARCPAMSYVRELVLDQPLIGPPSGRVLQTFAEWPHIAQLEGLHFQQDYALMTNNLTTFLACVPRLTALTLTGCNLRAFAYCWRTTLPQRIRRLTLLQCRDLTSYLGDFMNHAAFADLEALHADRTVLTEHGIATLAQAPWPKLRELGLANIPLRDESIRNLAQAPLLRELRFLNLIGCNLGDQAGRALLHSPHLEHLEFLGLDQNRFTPAVRQELRARFGATVVSMEQEAS